MIDAIIEFSARNRFLVFLLTGVLMLAGYWSMRSIPLDAIPDLSDTQVIIYSRWDRSPDIIEDQVTYPLVTAMLGAPRVKAVRGFSDFGYSYVYVLFEDGVDIYWARSRALEYLSAVQSRLPADVKTELGPDATGVGRVFQYALQDTSGKHSLAELRSLQDWFLRYHLKSVPGVAEVAPIGGFVRQYQVNVDPRRLQSFNIPIAEVVEAVRKGNNDVGGRLLEFAGVGLYIVDRLIVEPMIAASLLVFGLLVALRVRLPLVVGALVVATFAVFHGIAHGGELPASRAAAAACAVETAPGCAVPPPAPPRSG